MCLFWDRIHIIHFFPFIKISLVSTEEMWMDLEMDSLHRQCLLLGLRSDGVFFGHILSWVFLHCDKDPLTAIQTFQSGGLA